ncbi:DUF4435 domain-containing protein [Paracidovorax valerianellae]|uniref:Uncharacterized protein n=1 Tax=Paracidovorax valerianellae TaxID=187868 RepID=A0A1G7DEC9_9BURK|nr:DUF4435 domain-containing protein [Paracidovorax valerianellae]MDA8446670.1 DUF4435 domain-containing protein [Paracidovorax valerianellae]SDE49887.1 Protein of unknown function [Paracidovorax valerianellae]
MSTYDLKSYELVLMLRKRKTIVVEGSVDKRVISRILLEKEVISGKERQCVIDEVSLISRERSFSGLGNRTRVINTGVHFSNLTSNLKCLVDREWDGVNLVTLQNPHPPIATPSWGHMTHGHSIENYWFTASAACSFLKMHYGSNLQAQFFVELLQRFESMLRISVAFSLAAKRLNLITTCQKGLLKASHVIWLGNAYQPTSDLALAGKNRGIAFDLQVETQAELSRADLMALNASDMQWICHGHLGEQMLRACAANLATEFSNEEIAVDIERGFQEIKLAHDANWLATNALSSSPLNCLTDWAL